MSLDLGAMVDDGFLAQHQAIRDRLLDGGSMAPDHAGKFPRPAGILLLPSLSSSLTLADYQTIFDINTPKAMLARGVDKPAWMQRPLFGFFHRVPSSSTNHHHQHSSTNGGPRDFQAVQCQAASLGEVTQIIARALIVSCRVGSLLAVEVRGWLARVLQAEVSTFEILGSIGFDRVGRLVVIRSLLKKGWVG
ncbi:uncharacterized protein BO66DRAFT_434949 [Aspergillus aculeatinus CBS 121060]|uniref:Uncharacterized protein n=1 Tax=Aspergillus aculeatinus CBS 121060 TaxID=1448322 RepID=A0ACD1HJH3_9EURO|nr:hypothetical protein BO66DRAFT_434949 [Aspergillus aculeatinus CBS 121060]RAH73958.1 hypothetical protein BO66DRAFT_434949 [Aspergillus aculeatinus CBS 121060]